MSQVDIKDAALPQVGEVWEKRSFPLPTVVDVVGRHGDGTLTVKYGRRRITLSIERFIEQGFERADHGRLGQGWRWR